MLSSPPDYAVIIPARYESSRLPGKPLVSLFGVPMVVRTYRQCIRACPPERVYVATDDQRIEAVCREHGINVLMTSSDCLTGTDRVAECAAQINAEVFINVQGDEPVFNPDDLTVFIEQLAVYSGEILNGFCAIDCEAMYRSSSTPKVVMRPDGRCCTCRAPRYPAIRHMRLSALGGKCAFMRFLDVLCRILLLRRRKLRWRKWKT
ncbi:cytidylyltransferase domain-containing protein [Stutzerimonas zhaodongensis]|uniref:cytidylyltransferase domain-containing protein n=1 Tax=Stutzerimonas zhaodongensis TaxID=1176257 RepID=UPI001F4E078C|nr:hypothetical protein [Stutzerimonas zhaodongensis]